MKRLMFLAAVITGFASSASGQTSAPTFSKDVAPILYKNCIVCHREGQVAPMSLITYQEARPWAKAIKEKVANREMPPWGANPQFGKFKNDRSLTKQQIDTIVAWADGGAQKGNDSDLPPVPQFSTGWVRGDEPDAVVQMPIELPLPAEGEIENESYYTKTTFSDDVLIKALEVKPTAMASVHHGAINVVDKLPEGSQVVGGIPVDASGKKVSSQEINRANGLAAFQENTKLLSYVPGRGYEEYQGDAGQRIRQGAYLRFGMHYQATGKPEKDRTMIGLYMGKPGEVTHQIYHQLANVGPSIFVIQGKEILRKDDNTDDDFEDLEMAMPPIPPYADDFKVVSIHSVPEPITLYGLTPHLHLRGKSMRYMLTSPDGKQEVLLEVPKYDFNWQVYYELAEPRKIPAGSKVTVTTLFDNSLRNQYNPAPEKEVWWSEQSWDEMYGPQVRYTIDSRDLRKPKAVPTQQQQQQQ